VLAKTESIAIIGTEARLVDVEVDVGVGLPTFRVVGLAAKSITESEQRIRSALQASDERWPPHRIVANLAPGGVRKEGTHLDLPLALCVLSADGRLDGGLLDGWLVVGELALDGSVRSIRGTLAAAIACRRANLRGIVCPAGNAAEATVIDGIEVAPVRSLSQCIAFLKGEVALEPIQHGDSASVRDVPDLADVRGQDEAKAALEIAAAGAHNLLLQGPPGAGKTMLARRLPGILPPMSTEESLEVTRVYSVAGLLPEGGGLITERPFRTPHHNISMAGLLGGGAGLARPGEVSLASNGVLFLDEISLYRREALDSLRGPLEDRHIVIARSGGSVTMPSRLSLIAAMNPCACGHLWEDQPPCTCSALDLLRHERKLSGPLLDRFDMQIQCHRVGREILTEPSGGSTSEEIRARVCGARAMQAERFGSRLVTNASVSRRVLEPIMGLTRGARHELELAFDGARLSGRGVERSLKLSRTIADLAGSDRVTADHMSAAIQLRVSDPAERAA